MVKTLENNEEEYQCSECGVDVPADALLCQNCGASLDENSGDEISSDDEKEEFIEIPLTSDPALLTAILSLLDEKKIEYSINENSMENILGPTYSQAPRLLIRAELEEEVNEMIESVDTEEIEVLDSEVFKDLPPDKKDDNQLLEGVEGWLLVLLLILILGPISYIPYYIYDFFEMQNYLSRYPVTYTIIVLDLITGIYISFLSIKAGLKLYKLKPDAVSDANKYFNIFITYQVIGFIVVGFSYNDIKFTSDTILLFDMLITETISSVVYAIVAKLYLQNSERVKRTFGSVYELNQD